MIGNSQDAEERPSQSYGEMCQLLVRSIEQKRIIELVGKISLEDTIDGLDTRACACYIVRLATWLFPPKE